MSDPRLRLLGNVAPDSTGLEILKSLDATRILVRTGSDMVGQHTSALAAFLLISSRLFGEVVVETPVRFASNWWGVQDTTSLLKELEMPMRSKDARPTREIVVAFGDRVPKGDWGIGGDDYTARLGRDPQPLGLSPSHSLGVHASVCLGISQLMLEILSPLNYQGVQLYDTLVMNLIDYKLTEAPAASSTSIELMGEGPLKVVVAGVGSVGSSALALIATALSPFIAPNVPDELGHSIDLIAIDDDDFDPQRNHFRYPALSGDEHGNKAVLFSQRLVDLGIKAQGIPQSIGEWARDSRAPGLNGLLLSSVDTLSGRLDVTDVLSRMTLSIGVSGLEMHAQRESFADGLACSFCDFVTVAPPTTQVDSHSQLTGLSALRILSLLKDDARLNSEDIDIVIAANRLPFERREQLIGSRFTDLIRQVYAEASITIPSANSAVGDVIAIAAPQVSWFSGVIAAVEIVKQVRGLPMLDRRVDVDLSGLPPGLVRRLPSDPTGKCLCHSGVRTHWYRAMYSDYPLFEPREATA